MATDRTVQALAAMLAVASPGLTFAAACDVAFDALVAVPVVRLATVKAQKGLRLRVAPTTRAAVIRTLPDGVSVEVWGGADGWSFATFEDVGGWLADEFLEAVQVAYVLPAE